MPGNYEDNNHTRLTCGRQTREPSSLGDKMRRHRVVHSPADLVLERDLQAQVETILKAHGWRYFHAWSSQHSAAGYPDITAVRPPRLAFLELKREGARPTREQQAWLDDIHALGLDQVEDYVVYPSGVDKLSDILA